MSGSVTTFREMKELLEAVIYESSIESLRVKELIEGGIESWSWDASVLDQCVDFEQDLEREVTPWRRVNNRDEFVRV